MQRHHSAHTWAARRPCRSAQLNTARSAASQLKELRGSKRSRRVWAPCDVPTSGPHESVRVSRVLSSVRLKLHIAPRRVFKPSQCKRASIFYSKSVGSEALNRPRGGGGSLTWTAADVPSLLEKEGQGLKVNRIPTPGHSPSCNAVPLMKHCSIGHALI